MVPAKLELTPRVAEVPTCQNTLLARTPPESTTEVPVPVVNVEPIWKTKTELAFPVRVRLPGPTIPVELEVLYVPAVSVRPVRSPGRTAGAGKTIPAAKL